MEMSDMYTRFTESVARVLAEVSRIKSQVDTEILSVRNALNAFRYEVTAVQESTKDSAKLVGDNDDRVAELKGDVTNMKAAILEFTVTTARQQSLLECIDKTKVMCNQFNFAV